MRAAYPPQTVVARKSIMPTLAVIAASSPDCYRCDVVAKHPAKQQFLLGTVFHFKHWQTHVTRNVRRLMHHYLPPICLAERLRKVVASLSCHLA
jgi:hypothetical protein